MITIPNPKSNSKAQTYTIPTFNEYTRANRKSPLVGARMKRNAETHIKKWLPNEPLNGRYIVHIKWYEAKKNRDPDNIASAKKYILDAMQEVGILKNDGWQQIAGFIDEFYQSDNPRIEIYMEEV